MSLKSVVRVMQSTDITYGMVLKEIAGWNQLPLDWERFLEFEPEGCFVAEANGVLAGTCTTVSYDKLFGWVGMVLVHPDFRRQGLGRALLIAGIEYLENLGLKAVKLDATAMGKQLYDKLGFVDEYGLGRWLGTGGHMPQKKDDLLELDFADLDVVKTFDTPIFGAQRQHVLSRLLSEPTIRTAGCFARDGSLLGYVGVRPGQNAMYLGPLVAYDTDTAIRLWEWGLGVIGSHPVFVDVLLPNMDAVELVQTSGFIQQREFIRMYKGENTSPGFPRQQYAIFGPEVG